MAVRLEIKDGAELLLAYNGENGKTLVATGLEATAKVLQALGVSTAAVGAAATHADPPGAFRGIHSEIH